MLTVWESLPGYFLLLSPELVSLTLSAGMLKESFKTRDEFVGKSLQKLFALVKPLW